MADKTILSIIAHMPDKIRKKNLSQFLNIYSEKILKRTEYFIYHFGPNGRYI